MKYLLFVYYSEGEKTEEEIHQIATELSPIVDSDEIKYVYGPSHVVFNFVTEMSQSELSMYVDIITEDIGYFKYILIHFRGSPKGLTVGVCKGYIGTFLCRYRYIFVQI
jgi:hypothetical protein